MIAQIRNKMTEYDTKADRQLIANNGIVHAGWQARNVTSLQLSLNEDCVASLIACWYAPR